ncbi:hypothetical protein GGQ96_003137 [Sphingomonas abaci]|uniref:Uncharacterized protein n=1 Tax=Sphingomonas abaci TaxID=237611 RepID=A0A7W7AN11_9SPHN|nr:hypothetical protein [Sphingomonas abaci]
MAIVYRVTAFGEARAPWRTKKQHALQDAVLLGLAERDEWGQLYLDAPVRIEWAHDESIRQTA